MTPRTRTQTAAIIVIGDEILSGKFAEENAAYLIRELRGLGVAVKRVEMIPDSVEEIAAAVRVASARYDHVFTSGGVGPTHDDVTMEGIARAFGVPVVREPSLEAALRAHYGDKLEARNLRMADVPEGVVLVPANHPSWPVASVGNVYILPGVPLVFRKKFEAMRERFRTVPFHSRRVLCMAEEGALAGPLDAVVAAFPEVALGSYPRYGETEYRVILTVEGKDAEMVERATVELADKVKALGAGALVRVE